LTISSFASGAHPNRSARLEEFTRARLREVGCQQLAGAFDVFGLGERHVEDQAVDAGRDELLDLLHNFVGSADGELLVELVGNRIVAGPFVPWLERAGLQSTLRAGRFRGSVATAVRARDGGGVIASAKISALAFADGDDAPFFALEELRLDEVMVGHGAIEVGRLVAQKPLLRVARDADGALLACGLRIAPRAMATTGSAAPIVAPTAAAPAPVGRPTRPAVADVAMTP